MVSLRGRVNGNHRLTVHRISDAEIDRASVLEGDGHKHPLALIEGATENAAVVQALIDNLIERVLDPKTARGGAAFHRRLRGCNCLDCQRMRHLCDLFRWIVAGVASIPVSHIQG